MFPTEPTITEKVSAFLQAQRDESHRRLALIDRAQTVMERLPENVWPLCVVVSDWLQICSPSRSQVEEVLRSLGAGRMTKKPTYQSDTKIDYEGNVDGIQVIIHSAEPPPSCRIIEEQVYVPAHNMTKRTLVCH